MFHCKILFNVHIEDYILFCYVRTEIYDMNGGGGRGDFLSVSQTLCMAENILFYLSFEMSAHNSEDHVSYGKMFYSLKHIQYCLFIKLG
jgi:hypothetical protein